MEKMRSTTILVVNKDNKVAIASDGQVTFSNIVMKHKAKKVRKLYKDTILAGFAGAAADAFSLFEKFEDKLSYFHGNLKNSVVAMGKDWRTDKILRRLEAMLVVADKNNIYLLSGNGDVIEPDIPILAIGSGGPYAFSSAKALYENTKLSAKEIVEKSMKIAGEVCIYTNSNLTLLEL
jgi:ATP-dependent HslUV protease subunit HslV